MTIRISEQVRSALDRGGPVVALESSIVAHGFPYPDNIDIARSLEQAVREAGATPATIAVVDGQPRVGLDTADIERLGRDGTNFAKAGAADIGVHIARGTCAATTVSGTAWLAAQVGISVFATGGIGGVHRGDAADVSSDLATLARVPVCVVSSGAKAILDLPRTAEMLERLGVLVLGYRTSEFPAFYSRTSGIQLEHRVEDTSEVAAICEARWSLGQGGVLLVNPIPEAAAIDLSADIEAALSESEGCGITGKALTPFLLAHIAERTEGRAVYANRVLALSNAQLAGALSTGLSSRDNSGSAGR